MIFDIIVVAMTLVKTIQLNWGGASGGRTIIHTLMRDGKSICKRPPTVLNRSPRCCVFRVGHTSRAEGIDDAKK